VKKSILVAAVFAIALLMFSVVSLSGSRVQAQTTDTASPTVAGPSNTVQGFLVACQDSAIVNFNGTLLIGWDVFFQLSAASGPLSGVRQVSAGGNFTFSETVAYPAGTTVSPGTAVAARVFVARETNPATIDFEFTLTDVQDGCQGVTPQNPPGTSIDVSGGGGGGTTTGTTATNLFAPNGLTLNPNLRPEDPVVIGARDSVSYRSETPGLIFAECNEAELANPGIVYDNDRITVFWSWYTRTRAQMEDHLAKAQYSVRMNGASFSPVQVSEITQRGRNYWVFYSADAGFLRPGHYEVEYRVTWTGVHNDGYDDYGPGTDFPVDSGNCNFDVLRNPTNQSVVYSNIYFPSPYPWHNIFGDT
jgi:hypothetical protein